MIRIRYDDSMYEVDQSVGRWVCWCDQEMGMGCHIVGKRVHISSQDTGRGLPGGGGGLSAPQWMHSTHCSASTQGGERSPSLSSPSSQSLSLSTSSLSSTLIMRLCWWLVLLWSLLPKERFLQKERRKKKEKRLQRHKEKRVSEPQGGSLSLSS